MTDQATLFLLYLRLIPLCSSSTSGVAQVIQ
jgi:hypothetical protein